MKFIYFSAGLFNGQFTTAKVGEDEAPKAPRGWGVGGGVPLPTGGGDCAPSPEKFFFDSGSQYGEFGAFWVVFFLQFSYLFYTQNRCNLVPLPYFVLVFRFKKDLVHFLAFWRRQKFHAAGPVLVRPSECITLHLGLIARMLHRFSIVRRFLLKLRLTSFLELHKP